MGLLQLNLDGGGLRRLRSETIFYLRRYGFAYPGAGVFTNGKDMIEANAQHTMYTVSHPDSLAVKVATNVRAKLYRDFIESCGVRPEHTLLDVGVTSDQSLSSSNYLEALHPYKDKITACGIDDASFLEDLYPGVRFVHGNGLDLPFPDGAFDFVHSSAVIEHVGSFENQKRFVSECARVARIGFFLTTPNRWFPVEFHTQLPLVHWLPKPWCRAFFSAAGLNFFADETNLNLMTTSELRSCAVDLGGFAARVQNRKLLGWPSNLLLIGERLH